MYVVGVFFCKVVKHLDNSCRLICINSHRASQGLVVKLSSKVDERDNTTAFVVPTEQNLTPFNIEYYSDVFEGLGCL